MSTSVAITVLLGTARESRKSKHVAHYIYDLLDAREDVHATYVDVRDHAYRATTPPWGKGGADEETTAWKEIIQNTDGLLIVMPEYNHGYPGELKLLLDSLYDEYAGMPVALCGVSSGRLGGARAVENIKPVLTELKMFIVSQSLHIANVEEIFDENGTLLDESIADLSKKVIDMLIKHTRMLKTVNLG